MWGDCFLSLFLYLLYHSPGNLSIVFSKIFYFFFARGAGNQYQPLGFMRFQSLGLPSHSFLSFQSFREPYPAITSRVFVFLYAFNVLFICLISLSRGFCSPLFLYLLYHKFPDLSIVFSKKIKIFFYLFGTDCRTSFSCSYFQKLFELPKSGKFRGRATVRGKKKKRAVARSILFIRFLRLFCLFLFPRM